MDEQQQEEQEVRVSEIFNTFFILDLQQVKVSEFFNTLFSLFNLFFLHSSSTTKESK